MNIDDLTGLPELDEGQWWEVKSDKKIRMWIDTYALYDYGFKVDLVSLILKKDKLKKKYWWSKKKTFVPLKFPYQYEAVIGSEWITQADVSPDGNADKLATDITPEAVLKAAQRVMAVNQARHVSCSLIGKYPPNKLATQKDDNG
jgi:hypothetical protein